jgi:carbamoyl-phosphate synthase small subunit
LKAVLLLENGTIFKGINFGCDGETIGEVVFNTSMTGYQEILTDPSYYGQIITMTYPQIGNYGINPEDIESARVQASGFIVREFFDYFSNWRASGDLNSYLKKNRIVGISEIDTRMLTRIIRLSGAMKGIISTETDNISKLTEKLNLHPDMTGNDLVKYVTCSKNYEYAPGKKDSGYSIVALDFGIKFNILRCLDAAGFNVLVVNAKTSAEEILRLKPDGIFLSNGPGDPAAVSYAIKNISGFLGKIPVFGICLGHQLMALALGAKTYKLKFGHHGGNHPVKNLSSGRVEITTQNHGFSVDEESLKKIITSSYKVTHLNLNDNTIEGLEYPGIFAYSIQHHPEAGPGPFDSRYIFSTFSRYIDEFKKMVQS